MPQLTFHLLLAKQVARALDHSTLHDAEGAYLLGSTTPDIRALTRADRKDTHFFDLHTHEHQDSVQGFLDAHPHLADAAQLNPETRAFVAGYISHLVLDEQYITGIYRRFFARHDELGGAIRANVMDRLLQFGMDRSFQEDTAASENLARALACTVESIECGFVDHETLERWRQVTVDVATRGMDWERARQMIARHLQRAGIADEGELAAFLDSLPELENETIAFVTDAEVSGFIERSSETAARTIARYLECG